MQEFYLFIDTETSGLPRNWKLPYDYPGNWPYIIQTAWVIYDRHHREIKRENHFINNNDFKIKPAAFRIHGITAEDLIVKGKDRKEVMQLFDKDLQFFRPLVIGHFTEFDFHMVNTEFYRSRIHSIFEGLAFFCTMKASAPYVRESDVSLLRLRDFYTELFGKNPEKSHEALADALNTAEIFFHLLSSGKINQQTLLLQNNQYKLKIKPVKSKPKNLLYRLFSTTFYGS